MEISQQSSGLVSLNERSTTIFRLLERFACLRNDTEDFISSPGCPPMDTDSMPLVARIQDIIDELEGLLSCSIYSQFDPPRRVCGL